MAHDLRELFRKQRESEQYKMKEGHEERFLNRLEEDLPAKRKRQNFHWLGIAASVVFLLAIGSYLLQETDGDNAVTATETQADEPIRAKHAISLGDLSPDLQKIEAYYVTNINLALSKLEVSNDNKDIVDGYLERLEELNQEYEILSNELNEMGPNDQTIAAMVQNLQLRAQLLQKLNEKLNQLKTSKNEQKTDII